MANPLADEARALNDRQLAEGINEAYREVFNLQFQKGTRQLRDGLAIRRGRRQIARLRTVQRERQIAEVLGAPIAPSAAPAEAELSPQKRRALEERATLEAEEAELNADETDDLVTEVDAVTDVDVNAIPEDAEADDADEASENDESEDDEPDAEDQDEEK